mgnify:FL=1|jgi:hypothetical protein
MINYIVDACKILRPTADISIEGNDIDNIIWGNINVGSEPSNDEIQTEIDKLISSYNTQLYSRNRKLEYDALNQLELISDDAINSTTTLADAISAIKTKWPKDNSGPIE